MAWYFHACPNCGGDLHDDAEDRGWQRCLQCSRSYPLPGTVVATVRPESDSPKRRRRARHHDYGIPEVSERAVA